MTGIKKRAMLSLSPTQERKLRTCVIPACAGKRFDLVHKFPMDNERAETWRRIINVPQLATVPIAEVRKKYFICKRHFPQRDYKNCESRSLNKTALPRLFLTEGDNSNADNDDEAPLGQSLSDEEVSMHNSEPALSSKAFDSREKKAVVVESLIKLKKVQPGTITRLPVNGSKMIITRLSNRHVSPIKSQVLLSVPISAKQQTPAATKRSLKRLSPVRLDAAGKSAKMAISEKPGSLKSDLLESCEDGAVSQYQVECKSVYEFICFSQKIT